MSGVVQVTHVPYLPEVWLVPAGLADFECLHGELGRCKACDRDAGHAAPASSSSSKPLSAGDDRAAA